MQPHAVSMGGHWHFGLCKGWASAVDFEKVGIGYIVCEGWASTIVYLKGGHAYCMGDDGSQHRVGQLELQFSCKMLKGNKSICSSEPDHSYHVQHLFYLS